MNYATAIIYLADAVAADPFNMEHFRKYAFWAKVAIAGNENGKFSIAKKARNEMETLEDNIDVFNDITGVLPAIHNEVYASFKAARAA